MDDGYSGHLEQYDRAELAEQRLDIAVTALKHIRRQYPASESAVKLALKRVREHKQKAPIT
jgi:hypothetical protein